MPIVQKNPDVPNEVISIAENPVIIQVAPFTFPGGITEAAVFDLTPFQGGPFRLYLDSDGSFSTDLYTDHYWLLVEAILPDKKYDNVPTGMKDEDGNDINELQEAVLDLNTIDVTVFALPEVEAEVEE